MKICPECGNQNFDIYKICQDCGTKLDNAQYIKYADTKMYCTNCGAENEKNAKYCPNVDNNSQIIN